VTLIPRPEKVDAIVIGGGFYGCAISLDLKRMGLSRVALIEQSPGLLTRASYANQARIHNGYHYPRSFTTAFRSRANYQRFLERYNYCISSDFTMLYCIARRNSQVTGRWFEQFCRQIGARYTAIDRRLMRLFSATAVEAVFRVDESAFDARKLAHGLRDDLDAAHVDVRTNSEVIDVVPSSSSVTVRIRTGEQVYDFEGGVLLNCTYSRLHKIASQFGGLHTGLKFEIAEIALIEVPDELKGYGVTVMDGPFFSTMPFPSTGLHSLSHVRYTPHLSWTSKEAPDCDPYETLSRYDRRSHFELMQKDVVRFLPILEYATYKRSLFEVKAVLIANEADDARPILLERHSPQIYSVLGGKLDNIFDVLGELPKLTEGTVQC
jgi:glycine/D-amino acid oxidase-like deaminating enzyme